MGHFIFLVAELQRYKGIEAVCAVLQLAQPVHMIDTVLKCFDMAIKHGGVRLVAHLVPDLMNGQPFLAGTFATCNFITDVFIKDLSATAWKTSETGLLHDL